jgi:molybdate transport system ATP-binding protein
MVLIVHRTEERLAATTHVLTLDDGRIVAAGPVNHGPAPDGSGPWDAHRPVTVLQQSVRLPAHPPTVRCEVLIDMRTVTVRYGDAIALNHLSWTVRDGEHWAVTGPNGAGKSTLLKLITGDCLQVYANRIRLFGQARGAGQTLASVRRRLGVVSHELASGYQAGGNRRGPSVLDTVCSGFFDSVGLYRHCTEAQRAAASGWLDRLGMASLAHAVFDRLSQGQRQMVLIARAMVKSPQLLILDEPCSGLDAANRRTVLNLVESIGRGGGTGLIFVTHHEPEIPGCITHRLRLDNGQRVGCGAVDAT